MPIGRKLIEKPNGARNVEQWDVSVNRAYELEHILVQNADGSYRVETVYGDHPSIVWLKINVKFFDDDSARDFENKVRALLPEEGVW